MAESPDDDIPTRCFRVTLEGEVAFERHRREAAEGKLKDLQLKLGNLNNDAKRLVAETQKKSPAVAKIAMTLQENLSSISRGRSSSSMDECPILNNNDCGVSQEQADALNRAQETAQAEIDTLHRRIEECKRKLAQERETSKRDLAARDAEISSLHGKLEASRQDSAEQAVRNEAMLREMQTQLADELAQQHDAHQTLSRENELLQKRNAEMVEEKVQNTASKEEIAHLRSQLLAAQAVSEEREQLRLEVLSERRRFSEEMAEMSHSMGMQKWFDSLPESEKNATLDIPPEIPNGVEDRLSVDDGCTSRKSEDTGLSVRSDSENRRESLVWKQRELLIRCLRKQAAEHQQYLTAEDELKKRSISVHFLQQRLEGMSQELNLHRAQSNDSLHLQIRELQGELAAKNLAKQSVGTQTSAPLGRSSSQSQGLTPRTHISRTKSGNSDGYRAGSSERGPPSARSARMDENHQMPGKAKIKVKPMTPIYTKNPDETVIYRRKPAENPGHPGHRILS